MTRTRTPRPAPGPTPGTGASAPATKRSSARAKAAAMRAEAARREARHRSMIISGAVFAVLTLVIGVFVALQTAQRDAVTREAANPRGTVDGGGVVGAPSAPVTVSLYEDFQCPACKHFEDANAAQLNAWVDAGTVKIDYRPVAFLDAASTDRYSTRALNAAAAVLDTAPRSYPAFHAALYAEQPAEGGPGLSDERLIDLAVAAGAPRDAVATAVENRTYEGWAARVTDAASRAGVVGTPTVLVNGVTLADVSPAALRRAVAQAAAQSQATATASP